MTGAVDPNGPVSPAVVESVAADRDVDPGDLADLVAEHQRSVRDLPGVEELVYEWRKQFDGAVLDRTPDAYYLAVPAWVWDEFGESLGVSGDRLDALAAVHARVVERRPGVPDEAGDGRTLVVLDRRE